MIVDEAHEPEIEEENYFVSMTDMMVGMIFIFIILLMYYALHFRDVTEQLTSADKTRTEILQQLEKSLKEKGVEVTIDTQNGVLRLPDAILFDSGKSELKPEGKVAVEKLAVALQDILPCYTDLPPGTVRPSTCPPSHHHIESVYIEGHTDKDRLAAIAGLKDNWDLSVVRATNTYRELTSYRPDLTGLCVARGSACAPVLSVSGYGPQRPIDTGTSEAAKKHNRRIDLRLIMVAPDSDAVQHVAQRVGSIK